MDEIGCPPRRRRIMWMGGHASRRTIPIRLTMGLLPFVGRMPASKIAANPNASRTKLARNSSSLSIRTVAVARVYVNP